MQDVWIYRQQVCGHLFSLGSARMVITLSIISIQGRLWRSKQRQMLDQLEIHVEVAFFYCNITIPLSPHPPPSCPTHPSYLHHHLELPFFLSLSLFHPSFCVHFFTIWIYRSLLSLIDCLEQNQHATATKNDSTGSFTWSGASTAGDEWWSTQTSSGTQTRTTMTTMTTTTTHREITRKGATAVVAAAVAAARRGKQHQKRITNTPIEFMRRQ